MSIERNNILTASNEVMREPSVDVTIEGITEFILTSFTHDSKNFDGFCIGNAVPQQLEIAVAKDQTGFLANGNAINIVYNMGETKSGAIYPEFYITAYSYDAKKDETKITAKDALYTLPDRKFPVSVGSAMTIGQYFESFCTGLGFGSLMLEGGLYELPYPSGDATANFSETDNAMIILKRIAEACCCNAFICNGNTIALAPFKSVTSTPIEISSVLNFTVSADVAPINRVVLSRGDLNENTYLPEIDPANISEIVISNNPILDNVNPQIADYNSRLDYIKKLYTYFTGIDPDKEATSEEAIGQELISYSLNFKGNPGLVCGDVIRVSDRHNVQHDVAYFGCKLTMNSGMKADVTIKYNPTNTNSYSSKGTLKESVRYAGLQVDKANASIDALVSSTNTDFESIENMLSEYKDALHSADGRIDDVLAKYEGMEAQFTEMTTTIDGIKVNVTDIKNGTGASGIKNTLVTIDAEGVTVGSLGKDIETNINNEGMSIVNGGGEVVAEFKVDGAIVPILQAERLTVAGLLFASVGEYGCAYWIGV